MKPWVTILIAAVAAILLVAAAAVLLLQDEPAEEDRREPTVPEEDEEDVPPDRESPPPGDEEEPSPTEQQEATLVMTDAWIDNGDCVLATGDENQTCHRVQVLVSAGADDHFPVESSLWQGVDEEDLVHQPAGVVSPEPVPAGSSRTITISYDLALDKRLSFVHHLAPEGNVITLEIFEYGPRDDA